MENKTTTFLKTDDNIIINEAAVKWVKKMNECMNVCIKSEGCTMNHTHSICKKYNPDSYEKLNKHFD
jgi:hypothetical protein